MVLLSNFEPVLNQFDLLFRCRYTAFRLFLEDMEYIDRRLKPDSIDSTIGIPIKTTLQLLVPQHP
jgi:hypothetical protein